MDRLIALALVALALAGCASSADSIHPAYVSSQRYTGLTCAQLIDAAEDVSDHAAQLAGVQDKKATRDALKTGAALVIFWPAAFFVQSGDGAAAVKLARLRGKKEAIEEAIEIKRCKVRFQEPGEPRDVERYKPRPYRPR